LCLVIMLCGLLRALYDKWSYIHPTGLLDNYTPLSSVGLERSAVIVLALSPKGP
jgi:hypothetical protein